MDVLDFVPREGSRRSAAIGSGAPGSIPSSYVNEVALLNRDVLEKLAGELNDPGLTLRFAMDYARMWKPRYEGLSAAVRRRDTMAALDAVISVRTSALMVGGLRLARIAGKLETVIRDGKFNRSPRLLNLISALGTATVMELQNSYIHARHH